MFNFIVQLLQSIFTIVLAKRKDVIFTMLLLKKENAIYKRQLNLNLNKKKIFTKKTDRLILSLIAAISKRAVNHVTLVKPKTLLDWQKRFIKKYWTAVPGTFYKFMQVLGVGGVCKFYYGKEIAIFRLCDGDRECLL